MSQYVDAMRIGWEMVNHHQAFDAWFKNRNGHVVSRTAADVWSACAMGCAWLGDNSLGAASGPKGRCPECGQSAMLTAHLNDKHRWSVDRIADYLERVP